MGRHLSVRVGPKRIVRKDPLRFNQAVGSGFVARRYELTFFSCDVIRHNGSTRHKSRILRSAAKVQHLIDPIFKCDQISCHEFITGAGQFVLVMNLEEFPQTFVGIETHAILIGNSDQHQVEKLLHAGQSLIETLPEKPMVNPTEGTADGSDSIRPRRLRSFAHHHAAKLRLKYFAVYRGLCDLHAQFFIKLRFERQLREYHGLCDLHA